MHLQRCIYVDMKSMFHRERDLGRFSLCVKNYSDKYDDADTLEDARIFPGDYLSVHLHLPGQAQRRPPPPPNSGSLTAGHSGGYGGQSMWVSNQIPAFLTLFLGVDL